MVTKVFKLLDKPHKIKASFEFFKRKYLIYDFQGIFFSIGRRSPGLDPVGSSDRLPRDLRGRARRRGQDRQRARVNARLSGEKNIDI